MRNALTGRSDGSGDGADQPKELPDEEQIDFLLQYDRTEPFCHKIIVKQVERDADDFSDEDDPMGDIKDDISDGPDFGEIAQTDDDNLSSPSKEASEGDPKQFEGGEEAA